MDDSTVPRASWISPKLEAKSSLTHGMGLYLRVGAELEPDEIVTVAGGRIFPGDYEHPQDHAFSAAPGFLIAPLGEADIDYLMNHSCEPNCGMAGSVAWRAMRHLVGPVELTYDYCMGEAWEDWAFPCCCGAPACRGQVTGWDWKDPRLQERYWGYFAPHIEARILAQRLGPEWRARLRAFALGPGTIPEIRPRSPW